MSLLLALQGGGTTTTLTANVGAFTLTGNAALFNVSALEAAGSCTFAGVDAVFNISMPAEVGSYALTGNASTFTINLTCSVGAFALAGQDSAATIALTAEAGSFAFVGNDAALSATGGGDVTMAADAGAFVLDGVEAVLSATGQEVGGGAGVIIGGTFTRRQWRALRQQTKREKVIERKQQKRKVVRNFRLHAECSRISVAGGHAAAVLRLATILGPSKIAGTEAAAALTLAVAAGAHRVIGKRASPMLYEALYVEDEPVIDDTVVIKLTPRRDRTLSRRQQIRARRAA